MKMAEDMADRLDDLICTVDNAVTASDVDTLVFVVIGWFVFGGVILVAAHFLFRAGSNAETPVPAVAVADDAVPAEIFDRNVNEDLYSLPSKKENRFQGSAEEFILTANGNRASDRYPAVRMQLASPPVPIPLPRAKKLPVVLSSTKALENGQAKPRTASSSPPARQSAAAGKRPMHRSIRRAVVPVSIGSDQDCVAWANHCFR